MGGTILISDMKLRRIPVKGIADSLDCNPKFHGSVVETKYMMLVMLGTVVLLGGVYFLITALLEKRR